MRCTKEQGDTTMKTINFENVLSPDEMSLIKGGDWVLTEDGWEWRDETQNIDEDDWDL